MNKSGSHFFLITPYYLAKVLLSLISCNFSRFLLPNCAWDFYLSAASGGKSSGKKENGGSMANSDRGYSLLKVRPQLAIIFYH